MALFDKSSNPTVRDSIFKNAVGTGYSTETMTVKGTVVKTFILLFLAVFAASYTWSLHVSQMSSWMIGGLIAGFVLAIVIVFAPKTAPYLAPVYALAEGLALGAISSLYNQAFAELFPGIVTTAVAITLLTALVMLFCYQTGLIRVTNKLRATIVVALVSVMIFYAAIMLLSLFKVPGLAMFYAGSSLGSIAISVVITIVAALCLLLDFDFIERGSQSGAPKYLEWYGAFSLMVTLVWLYLEILRLLSKIANR
ncbi:MAG: Bax inhibitor-1/YccA family protein [Prevotellaceae bacterium]|jgi:uncharacterized YccA/Bax inhibitor family protein|nr:Bax inhibitor-1/YccA family protein [Prevotellaceae bacterium]